MLETSNRKQLPYYGSYAGFYRALKDLKDKGVPRRIEPRFFGPALKNEATRVVAGFNSLGWTNDVGQPTEELRKIVDAFGDSNWEKILAEIVPKAYPYLETVDLEAASSRELRAAFIAHTGRDAEVIRNIETFFLCISHEAGRPMSEAFVRRAERGVGDARRWLKLAESGVLDTAEMEDDLGTQEDDKPRRRSPTSSTAATSSADRIVELSSWLVDGDMSDKEKDAVYILMGYLGRKHKQGN